MVAREKAGAPQCYKPSSTATGNLTRSPPLAWPGGPQSASCPANPVMNPPRRNQISVSVARVDFYGERERARIKFSGIRSRAPFELGDGVRGSATLR
jgi:hypothetical protein